jgi:hypothetical protein
MSDFLQCPACIGTGQKACDACSGWHVGGCDRCGGSNAISCGHCAGERRVRIESPLAIAFGGANFVERHGGRFFAAGTVIAATATALVLVSHLHI